MSFSGAARFSGGGGRIVGLTVLDRTQAQRSAIDLFLFSASVTVASDNAVATFSDADMVNCLGQLDVTTNDYNTAFAGTPANSIAAVPRYVSAAAAGRPGALSIPFVCAATTLFVAAVVRGTPTYTSTGDLTFGLHIEQD
jgi:hypothetical protein